MNEVNEMNEVKDIIRGHDIRSFTPYVQPGFLLLGLRNIRRFR